MRCRYEKYINTGFQIFNKKHRKFQEEFLKFHIEKKEMITWIQQKFGVGSEQTPLNLFIELKNIDFKLLPYEFNMTALFQKEILDEELTFTKLGWIYHFNGIEGKDEGVVADWMRKTHNYLEEL